MCPICGVTYTSYQVFVIHTNTHKRRKQFAIKCQKEKVVDANSVEIDDFPEYKESVQIHENSQDVPAIPIPIVISNNQLENNEPNVYEINSSIQKQEALFALKLKSKHLLPREVINDIFAFCENIHASKVQLLSCQLEEKAPDFQDITQVTDTI